MYDTEGLLSQIKVYFFTINVCCVDINLIHKLSRIRLISRLKIRGSVPSLPHMLLLINQNGTGALEIDRGLSTSFRRDLLVLLRPLLVGRKNI